MVITIAEVTQNVLTPLKVVLTPTRCNRNVNSKTINLLKNANTVVRVDKALKREASPAKDEDNNRISKFSIIDIM